jgi:hypothetical protein
MMTLSRMRIRSTCLLATALMIPSTMFGLDEYRAALSDAVTAKERALDSDSVDDWNDTLVKLKMAEAIRVTAETKYEIGYAAARLAQVELAVDAFEQALELGLTGTAREKARTYLNAQNQNVARLLVLGPAGWKLTVNGVCLAQLPLERPVIVRAGATIVALDTDIGDVRHVERRIDAPAGGQSTLVLEPNKGILGSSGGEPLSADAGNVATNGEQSPPQPKPPWRPNAPQMILAPESHAATQPPSCARRAGLILVGTGMTVGILSGIYIPHSTARISNGEKTLQLDCDVQVDGPDSCKNAKFGRQQDAQDASNSIATWKAVRTVSWIGLASGISATVSGLIALSWSNSTTPQRMVLPQVLLDRNRAELRVDMEF